jgi:hypothetical protein
MPLYQATVTLAVYVVARDFADAEERATRAFADSLLDGNAVDDLDVALVAAIKDVDPAWLDCVPYGDNRKVLTCREVLEGFEA